MSESASFSLSTMFPAHFQVYENNFTIPPSYPVAHAELISKEQPDIENNLLPKSLFF